VDKQIKIVAVISIITRQLHLLHRRRCQIRQHWPLHFSSYIYLMMGLHFRPPLTTKPCIDTLIVCSMRVRGGLSTIKCMWHTYMGVRGGSMVDAGLLFPRWSHPA